MLRLSQTMTLIKLLWRLVETIIHFHCNRLHCQQIPQWLMQKYKMNNYTTIDYCFIAECYTKIFNYMIQHLVN
jgi:hypothetical protein